MLLNIAKCKVMHFGNNSSLVDYCMNSMQLQNVKEERDLGIVIRDESGTKTVLLQPNKLTK